MICTFKISREIEVKAKRDIYKSIKHLIAVLLTVIANATIFFYFVAIVKKIGANWQFFFASSMIFLIKLSDK